MTYFNPLRTQRLSVDMQELTIDQAEALCEMPPELEQEGVTAMLKFIVKQEGRPLPDQVVDPRMWTVQERMLVMAHYQSHVTEGDPNFEIGNGARFSDYMLDGTDYVESVSLGLIDGEEIVIRPLLGFQAEAIERIVLGGRMRKNRLSWWACAMACQMYKAGETPPIGLSDADYQQLVLVRAQAIRSLTESEFATMLYAFLAGTRKLDHFFQLVYTDDAIAAEPVTEGQGFHPTRFPVRAAIRSSTLRILGIPDEIEGASGDVLQSDGDRVGADEAEPGEAVLR